MKKIFMASLVAMMAVTTANAYIASTEYTDATFVAKEGFNELVAATPQVTANKTDIEGVKSDIVGLGNVKQFKSDKDYQMGNSKGEWTAMTEAQQNALNSGVTELTVNQVAALQLNKVNKNQTVANANKAMVTDGKGDVVPGLISPSMISNNAVKLDHLNSDVKAVLGNGVNAMEAIEDMNSETTGAGTVVKSVEQTEGKVTVGLGYIGTDDIADNAVTTAKIAGNAVMLDHLNSEVKVALGNGQNAMQAIEGMNSATTGTGTVVKSVEQTQGKVTVGLGYIGTDDIADNAVTTAKIADKAVGGVKIADSGVATRNIADDAIVTSKILDANVTTAKIADNAVTTAKILDANVTKAKLDASVKATLDKADNAMQETGLKALSSWKEQKCDTEGVTCSLVSKSGIIAWEAVQY